MPKKVGGKIRLRTCLTYFSVRVQLGLPVLPWWHYNIYDVNQSQSFNHKSVEQMRYIRRTDDTYQY